MDPPAWLWALCPWVPRDKMPCKHLGFPLHKELWATFMATSHHAYSCLLLHSNPETPWG